VTTRCHEALKARKALNYPARLQGPLAFDLDAPETFQTLQAPTALDQAAMFA
jgi:hypothetical protein